MSLSLASALVMALVWVVERKEEEVSALASALVMEQVLALVWVSRVHQ